ncbi:MAG: putative transposase [Bradyrhizobium sp.]|nr:putative transposase [Bradyrhizobium sp.]
MLIRRMSVENPLWGAPRIHGELLKLGFQVAQSTVAEYMARSGRGRSQTWKTFLCNHAPDISAMDMFVVPTIGFKFLYGIVIMRLDRRRLVWSNVTANPTAEWIARQITEAFPWDEAPRYLLRDRDRSYGAIVRCRLRAMGIRDHPTAPRSPWQNGHVERLIGSIRRECLDHIVVMGEASLRRTLKAYARYYNEVRTHRSLDKDSRSSVRFSLPEASTHAPCLADFIITTFGFRFSVHTTDAIDTKAHESQSRGRSQTLLYNELRTHLSLDKDSPGHRPIQRLGQVAAGPILGGLHHEYYRM